ncbi:MAG: DUF1849 family protein [Alphaproteobacteria bacterium]|nr:DUF1849 family protein [Alphaproteobacteria bacterium]
MTKFLPILCLIASFFLLKSALAGAPITALKPGITPVNFKQSVSFSPPKGDVQIKKCAPALQPHRAEYEITLHKSTNPEIADVKGTLTVQLADVGNGWTFEQHSTLQVYSNDGSAEQYITTIVSWESKDGRYYRFNVRSLHNGVEEDCVRGNAAPSTTGEGVMLNYEQPTIIKKTLPGGVLFPIQHLQQALFAAASGQNSLPNKTVFDGSSEAFEPVEVNTIITPVNNLKLVVNDPRLLCTDKAWSLQMAIFPQNSQSPDPEYEISQIILPSGIIASMVMEYGEGFSTQLTLKKVDVFSPAQN